MRTLLGPQAHPPSHRKPPGAVKTHEQRLHPDSTAVTPDEQLRSVLTNKTTPGQDVSMLHQPALELAEGGPAKGRPIAARREAWCLMLDGTWQLVRVVGWQHDGGRWRCLLQ